MVFSAAFYLCSTTQINHNGNRKQTGQTNLKSKTEQMWKESVNKRERSYSISDLEVGQISKAASDLCCTPIFSAVWKWTVTIPVSGHKDTVLVPASLAKLTNKPVVVQLHAAVPVFSGLQLFISHSRYIFNHMGQNRNSCWEWCKNINMSSRTCWLMFCEMVNAAVPLFQSNWFIQSFAC